MQPVTKKRGEGRLLWSGVISVRGQDGQTYRCYIVADVQGGYVRRLLTFEWYADVPAAGTIKASAMDDAITSAVTYSLANAVLAGLVTG